MKAATGWEPVANFIACVSIEPAAGQETCVPGFITETNSCGQEAPLLSPLKTGDNIGARFDEPQSYGLRMV